MLAPLAMKLVGFANLSATQNSAQEKTPFDDIQLCFESTDSAWPGRLICVTHLYSTPLLRNQTNTPGATCGVLSDWTGQGPSGGRLLYQTNESRVCNGGDTTCGALLGYSLSRGDVIGYAGQVSTSGLTSFQIKVKSVGRNTLARNTDPYLHWVQGSTFFYWKCFTASADFSGGILAFPYDCGSSILGGDARLSTSFKY